MQGDLQYPVKTRDIHNHHMDSTIWDDFILRDDDIIIGTWAKSGTTWMQQIIGQMLLGPDPQLKANELSPWLDIRVAPKEEIFAGLEAQENRRFIKTHLPADALKLSPKVKYIYIARDGRDALWSWYHHHCSFNEMAYEMLNETPGLVGPKLEKPCDDIRQYWHEWLDNDGYPIWSFWENIRTWWEVRHLPNVKMIHFADLKQDMVGTMQDIAEFLEVDVAADDWPAIAEYCSFDWMKENSDLTVPMGGVVFTGGSKAFMNKGVNGRWRDTLSVDECAEYEAIALKELGPECAHWLAHGTLG